MSVIDQEINERYALYNGDCIEVLAGLPDRSVHASIYSPPFCGLYHYSSSDRDMSNCRSYGEFFEHYRFLVRDLLRLTMPGRISAVHCMDVPGNGANLGGDTVDFPGDIIRLHKECGWHWVCRYHVWKEPLSVRNRTMSKSLAHQQIVEDSAWCDNASADQLLIFRRPGDNPVRIEHPTGLSDYIGEREVPRDLLRYRNFKGKQTENRLSHWIWRQYASAFWDDVRVSRTLPYKEARDAEDEKHMHPLQLDVIERAVTLWTNPGEVVLTPFLGVGSEVYGAVRMGRKGIGVELKPSYYRQAVKNLASVDEPDQQLMMFRTDEGLPLSSAISESDDGTMVPSPINGTAFVEHGGEVETISATRSIPLNDAGTAPEAASFMPLPADDEPDDDADWQGLGLDILDDHGMSPVDKRVLNRNGILTFGRLVEFLSGGKGLSSLPGIGPKSAERIDAAVNAWLEANPA